ncbi:hypothetical protein GKC56_02335 [Neisseriaceae bacterium PsAf]|nr:hypothetical protein [Neisseriaceae bacterium PsAf]
MVDDSEIKKLNKYLSRIADNSEELLERYESLSGELAVLPSQLKQEVKKSDYEVTELRYKELEDRTKKLTSDALYNIKRIDNEIVKFNRKMNMHYLVGIGVVIFMIMLILGISMWYLNTIKRDIEKAREDLGNWQYNTTLKKAIEDGKITRCANNKPCASVDIKAGVYGDGQNQYYLIK